MNKQTVNIIGIPFDGKSSYLKGAALAPPQIRKALHSGASNYTAENGIDIVNDIALNDLGDIKVENYESILPEITQSIISETPNLFLGGDHSITYPLVKAMHLIHGKFDILHFDAHADLYDEYEGDKYSHACTFARIVEENLASRIVQVGIRTLNKHQREQSEKFGTERISMKKLNKLSDLSFENKLYISIDLDGFDPAFAPGVSHHEPGGLTPRVVINLIHKIDAEIISADIVELNPKRDVNDITAALAAKLLKELVGKMAF